MQRRSGCETGLCFSSSNKIAIIGKIARQNDSKGYGFVKICTFEHVFCFVMSHFSLIDSPVGSLLLTAEDSKLTGIRFANGQTDKLRHENGWREDECFFRSISSQLRQYFDGERKEFDIECSFDLIGTPFQRLVWDALKKIPYGSTRTYRDIAEAIDRPKSYRAVGQANHHNPFVIVVPCHRVVGSNGSLTGFGGGMENKKLLLDLERGSNLELRQ